MPPRLHTPTKFDEHIGDLSLAIAVVATACIVMTLLAFGYLAWNPLTRRHLNRVSFRLLIYSLCASLCYALTYFVAFGAKITTKAACGVNVFVYNCCLTFSGAMFFSMALNLQLVLVHGFNGQKMEKCYILGAGILTLACNIPPYAAVLIIYSYWDINETCWFNSPQQEVQRRWFIGTQGFWMFAMSFCEVVSFLTVVGYMILRHRVRSEIGGTVTDTSTSSLPTPPIPQPPIVMYRKIILRIAKAGLYPLFSCFFNVTSCVLDFHIIQDHANTEVNWRLSIIDLLVYSIRPILYTFLAATDPVILRALHAIRHPQSELEFANPNQKRSLHFTMAGKTMNTWSSSGAGTINSSMGYSTRRCDAEAGDILKAGDGNAPHDEVGIADVTAQI
ncbi:hypothetical protein MVEN_00481700 [Mycena venus]|uniref:G-protein coupled receptors family 2 profile 2 domain-containing protein n=1 Tax=Mycena venus TaxID=2733690 RepID=A0A8H7D998_9AGAR|nr:hypothetical protein MVEN_00481700 [Mycena venus]